MTPIIIPVGGVGMVGSGECRQMTPTEKIVMTPILSGIFLGLLLMVYILIDQSTDSVIGRIIFYISGFCLCSLILVPLILCW